MKLHPVAKKFRWRWLVLGCALLAASVPRAVAQQDSVSQQIRINGYAMDIVLDPARHTLTAKVAVAFTALRDLPTVSFRLNPALQVTSVTDANGHLLTTVRAAMKPSITARPIPPSVLPHDGIVEVTPSDPLRQGQSARWTFVYSGVLGGDSGSAAPGKSRAARLASIGDPISYLLYDAEWFPMAGDETDRFSAAIHVHVEADERAIGSGAAGAPHLDGDGRMVFDFEWPHPGFPGTIIAGKFAQPYAAEAGSNIRVYVTQAFADTYKSAGQTLATTANREYKFLTSMFGLADSNQLNIVELPDDAVPAYAAPEIVAIAGEQMLKPDAFRLLSNTIAKQWWGNVVSPATRDDAWITNGMARYSELLYLENLSGHAALANAVLDISTGALLYDSTPLGDAARYSAFSPEFEAMTYDKGAMIFRMLQWQLGDDAFQRTLRSILSQYAGKSISSTDVEKIAEAESKQSLQPFFTQWLHNTGAPALQDKWTLYRLGNNAGFRMIGEIDQDLDLFQMPVDVRVETDGKTVNQRVDVEGTQTQFAIDTFGLPRKISLDPENWLLRNSPEMQVRVHILRGQQMAAGGDNASAIGEYRQALALNAISSLASYRLGDVYFDQRNYQAAANAYRDALRGDNDPKWIEAWSDLQLGKIFDASGQRDRAVNQYQEVLQTGDNTGGALDLARAYIHNAYKPPAK